MVRMINIEHLIAHPLGAPQDQEPTETSKQPIRTRYLGHVTGYQPIRGHYKPLFLTVARISFSLRFFFFGSVSGSISSNSLSGSKSTFRRDTGVFILDLYKRWASPRKKLTKLGHETSYLDYFIPSFKVPGVFGVLVP
eukprot:sb/3474432/